MTKRRALWIGDAGVSTGFARCTHEIGKEVSKEYDLHILALGYDGDPHDLQWPVYRAGAGAKRDPLGRDRVSELVSTIGPSVVVVQNDPWNIPHYLQGAGNCPVVAVVAVDGLNCRGSYMNGCASVVFWTKFGEEQARLGGYAGQSAVVPLGVDLDVYKPMDRGPIHQRMNMQRILSSRGLPPDTFMVGVVGRNQQRKRLDLTLQYFADWVHTYDVPDAALWIQQAPTGEQAYDLEQLGKYYKISDRVMLPPTATNQHGLSEEQMARVYNVLDCMVTTTQGEGWGLPQMEGMACGVPQVVPAWAALAEWADGVAVQVPCTATAVTPNGINVIGGIADRRMFCEALDRIYRDKQHRAEAREAGLRLVQQPEYRWSAIGKAMTDAVNVALHGVPVGQKVTA